MNDILERKVESFEMNRSRFEDILQAFHQELVTEWSKRNEHEKVYRYTEFEVLMMHLVSFFLPDKKCRAVMEYDPDAERIMFFREHQEQ